MTILSHGNGNQVRAHIRTLYTELSILTLYCSYITTPTCRMETYNDISMYTYIHLCEYLFILI